MGLDFSFGFGNNKNNKAIKEEVEEETEMEIYIGLIDGNEITYCNCNESDVRKELDEIKLKMTNKEIEICNWWNDITDYTVLDWSKVIYVGVR